MSKSNHLGRKYSILEKLEKMSLEQYRVSKNKLPVALGVAKVTFKKWLYIKKGEKAGIPLEKLRIIAGYFNVTIEDLMNEEIPVINYEQLKKLDTLESKQKFGLK